VSEKRLGSWKRNWPAFLRSLVTVRWMVWRPQLVIGEKYESAVKWASRGLAALGIVSSVFIFPSPLHALSFAIAIFLVQQFFEKAVFVYTSMYMQPMPDFTIIPSEWLGIGYAFSDPPAEDKPNLFGPAFATQEYAERVFELLRSWNDGRDEDRDENICVSFVIEGNGNYTAFIYPNPRRPSTTSFFREGDKLRRTSKRGREHQKLVVMFTFCKTLPLPSTSLFHRFAKEYLDEPARPIFLQAFRLIDGVTEMLYDINPILKWNLKIKRREDLAPSEMEYTFRNRGNKPIE